MFFFIFLLIKCICYSCYMVLLKLLLGFVKFVLVISRSLPDKNKLKFEQDFKASDLN